MSAYGDFDLSDEEIADYAEVMWSWQEEDIEGYRDVLEAKEDTDLLGGYIMVELDEVTVESLVSRARERGIEPSRLASEILRNVLVENER
jgi:hypothetical protein